MQLDPHKLLVTEEYWFRGSNGHVHLVYAKSEYYAIRYLKYMYGGEYYSCDPQRGATVHNATHEVIRQEY